MSKQSNKPEQRIPAETAPSVVFDQVCIDFEGQDLFSDLSLSIEGGKCTCILGPSGCGKSTLLRLISGSDLLQFSGNVYIEADNIKDVRYQTAWMSQKDLLLPWFNVLDNVLLGARLRNQVTPESREKALHLLTEAGLTGYEHAYPDTLSGGMRQRVALLRTLMEDRSILLMDEPFSSLDALTRLKLQDLSVKLTHGATVILVTHDPMEALRMADQVVVLSTKPTRIKRILSLEGKPPREGDDPEVHHNYSGLIATLMEEDQQ